MGKVSGDQKSKQEITITYMMMCIVTVFLITKFPAYLTVTLLLTGVIKPKFWSVFGLFSVPVLNRTIWIFTTLNSTVNTIIYCIFNKKFKDILFHWFPSKLRNDKSFEFSTQSRALIRECGQPPHLIWKYDSAKTMNMKCHPPI